MANDQRHDDSALNYMTNLRRFGTAWPILRDILSARDDRKMRKYLDGIGMNELETLFRRNYAPIVRSGPFAGMQLFNGSCGSVWIPKLLGCYELELAPYIEEAISLQPDMLVDVGCAEGYFAVGFARRLPKATVVAADTNPFARAGVRRLALQNAVADRVHIRGWVTHQSLEEEFSKAKSPVLWCDVEGGEAALLNPSQIPSLRKTWMMVEDHSHASNCPTLEILARFEQSHECVIVKQNQRMPSDWIPPELIALLKANECELAVSELRPSGQTWMVMRPRP